MINLNAYKLRQHLNFKSLLQQFLAEGITDITIVLARIEDFERKEHLRKKNQVFRGLNREEKIEQQKNRTNHAKEQEKTSKIIMESPVCPYCNKYHLTRGEVDGVLLEVCADLSKGSPKVGCGFSRMVK